MVADSAGRQNVEHCPTSCLQQIDTQADLRRRVEPEAEPNHLVKVVANLPPLDEPSRKAERAGDVTARVVRRIGKDGLPDSAIPSRRNRDGIGCGGIGVFVGQTSNNRPQHTVQKTGPPPLAEPFGDFDGFIHGRVRRHRRQENRLIGPELHQRPQPAFHLVPLPLDVRLNQRIQRGLPADDSIHHLRRQPAFI